MKLYHYTTIDTLALILDSKSIKFSRLDQLDDKMESEPFADFNPLQYIFSASFTNDAMESIPMWKMYANMETGIRIEFDSDTMFNPTVKEIVIPKHEHEQAEYPRLIYTAVNTNDILNSDYALAYWHSKEEDSICQCIKLKKITYINDFKEKYKSLITIDDSVEYGQISRNVKYNPYDFGFYKNEYWSFQREVRLFIYAIPFAKDKEEINNIVANKRPLKSTLIFVPLSDRCLQNLTITLSPKITYASRIIVKALLAKYPHVKIMDSCLSNTIR